MEIVFIDDVTREIFNNSKKGEQYVYVLLLTDNRFFVGYSVNLQSRLKAHFRGKGATFTKHFSPVNVLGIMTGGKDLEKQITLEMMKVYGMYYVRGYCWNTVDIGKNFPSFETIDSTPLVNI